MIPLARNGPQFELGAAGWYIDTSAILIVPAGAPTTESAGGAG
jgi:hypothetical protein